MSPNRQCSSWEALRADLHRYFLPDWSLGDKVWCALVTKGIWLLASFRAGSWIYHECPRRLASVLKLVWKPLDALLSTLYDTHITVGACIGPGLYVGHYGGIWINSAATIGACCNISQGVIIGAAGGGDESKAPVLGDRVWVGPHAIITGSVRVGSNSVVAANSLVAADVPAGGLVIGVPARLLCFSGSSRLIRAPKLVPPKPPAARIPSEAEGPALEEHRRLVSDP